MDAVAYSAVAFGEGFWRSVRETEARVSLKSIYRRFCETGRFSALDMQPTDPPSHIYFDSDVAKWLEAAACLSVEYPDAEIAAQVHDAVRRIVAGQRVDGYFNSFFQVYAPDAILTRRMEHELYCAGHLIEAAVALDETGLDGDLLPAMRRYADYLYERFYERRDAGFVTCGHPEIELALARLYRHTGEARYLTLARFFVDERGRRPEPTYAGRDNSYEQSHMPVREQREAVGHAVRALYLYTGMSEVGRLGGDASLLEAARRLYDDAVGTKMYVTGGMGSSYEGERFTSAYDLPNEYAYAETCAGIALVRLSQSLRLSARDPRFDDVIERALHNNVLAGQSLDGTGFFYTNPLEAHAMHALFAQAHPDAPYQPILERRAVFDCSCCPPNLMRLLGELGAYVYGVEDGVALVRQYISSRAQVGPLAIEQESEMPFGGKVRIRAVGKGKLRLRVPSWCDRSFRTEYDVDGVCEIALDLAPRPRFVYANQAVCADNGRKAVLFGPLVLCAEGIDNGAYLSAVAIPSLDDAAVRRTKEGIFALDVSAERLETDEELYSFDPPKRVPFRLRLIPYYAWANRCRNDMQVWFL